MRYDANPGVGVTHTIQNSLFQECITGVYVSANTEATLTSVQKCDVTTPTSGHVTGQMTVWTSCDTSLNSATKDTGNLVNGQPAPQQNTQNETSVTVTSGKIIAAWMDTNHGHESLGDVMNCCYTKNLTTGQITYCQVLPQFLSWGVSSDGGQTFVDKGEPPVFQYTDSNGQTAYLGDAGDPTLATYGTTVYLDGNPQRPSTYKPQGSTTYRLYMPFWKSTDLGQTFAAPLNIVNVSTGSQTLTDVGQTEYLDKPWLVANPSNGDLYLAVRRVASTGYTILFFRSLDGGQSWAHQEFADSTGSLEAPYLAVGGTTIYLLWKTGGNSDPIRIRKSTDRGATFQNSGQNGQIPNSQLLYEGNLRRNSHTDVYDGFAADTFRAAAIFQAAVNPQSGHLYLVYHNRPNGAQDTDIFLQYSTDGGTTWTAPLRVNDVQAGDQWQPALAVKPDGSKLFIGWYDRKHDTLFNHRIRVRGMISTITQQTPLSSPSYFEISVEDFAPVFTGTQTVDGTFDPVYGNEKTSFSTDQQGNVIFTKERCGQLHGHMGDYDQIFSDSSFIYFCWGDNRVRRSGRLQADARFKKLSW